MKDYVNAAICALEEDGLTYPGYLVLVRIIEVVLDLREEREAGGCAAIS